MKKTELEFLKQVPQKENIIVPGIGLTANEREAPADEQTRLFYVIVQCIPIPLMKRFTSSKSIIVPVILNRQQPLKQIYKSVNGYLKHAIEDQGLNKMKHSTKLILSE